MFNLLQCNFQIIQYHTIVPVEGCIFVVLVSKTFQFLKCFILWMILTVLLHRSRLMQFSLLNGHYVSTEGHLSVHVLPWFVVHVFR